VNELTLLSQQCCAIFLRWGVQNLSAFRVFLLIVWSYLAVPIDADHTQRSVPTSGKVDQDQPLPMEDELRVRRCIHCRVILLPGRGA
jgi:RNase P subunit RPR2